MSKTTKPLSVPQLLVLTTAAGRCDRMVLPLPPTLRARGASQQRLLASLLKLTLVEEVPTEDLILSWRQDEQGQHYALQLTTTGLAAVVNTAEPHRIELTVSDAAAEIMTTEPQAAPASLPVADDEAPALPVTPGGKLGKILRAVEAEHGATVDELVALTGWQKHTTRAALTRLRQRGYPLQLFKQPDRKAYCLVPVSET